MQSSVTGTRATPSYSANMTDALVLKSTARQFVEAYPDIYGLAYAAADSILKKHTTRRLRPDKVYWHRFDHTMSSGRSFTGWAHRGAPVESLTLVELVMHRFSAHDQEAADDLQVFSGFYTDGPEHGIYGDRNEVAMLPRTVLEDFWALDFSTDYRLKVEWFWAANTDNFRVLAKARFLGEAGLAFLGNGLVEADYQTVIHSVAHGLSDASTLGMLGLLQQRVAPQAGIALRRFDIGGYIAHDIVRIVVAQGRQILYIPGRIPAFQGFASDDELARWVRDQLTGEAERTRFTAHFFPSRAAREQDGGVFDSRVELLRRGDQGGPRIINQIDELVTGDLFDHLGQRARQDMIATAELLLTSNGDLRKQMLLGYLNAFIRVFGGLTPLGWPMTLVLVGAGVTSVGLNIDQAINGNSRGLRKAGVIGAVIHSIFVLFNLPTLTALGRSNELSLAIAAQESDASLEEWAGNIILGPEPEAAVLERMQGIHTLANGETWISLEGQPYRVQYIDGLRTWAIVDPANPFAFNGARPVRFNVQGLWQRVPKPRLAGGTPMEPVAGPSSSLAIPTRPYATIRSAFWDTHMRFDLPEEMRLSSSALLRQKQVINVKVFQEGDEIITDQEGSRILRDRWGNEYRVYQEANGIYNGGRIFDYSASDTTFNGYLRTGLTTAAEQVTLVKELAEDLDSVGRDNEVALFRGGSGARNTSGLTFRSGRIKVGDLLVNTDFTSFSENPYMARVFSSSQGGVQSGLFDGHITFDETSVVFELPAKSYLSATPAAPFSSDWEEAESIFKPGVFFRIDNIDEVSGLNYSFIRVQMQETAAVSTLSARQQGRIFELRTGEPFTREQYAARLGEQGRELVELFFPER